MPTLQGIRRAPEPPYAMGHRPHQHRPVMGSRANFAPNRRAPQGQIRREVGAQHGTDGRSQNQGRASTGQGAGVRGCARSAKPPESISTAPLRRPWWIGKPGSVVERHSSGMNVTTHLVRPTRRLGRVNPRRLRGAPAYLVLLPGGFAVPVLLPVRRWALTPPFHPCLIPRKGHRRFTLCCTIRRVSPPRYYLAHCPAESGLSSAA